MSAIGRLRRSVFLGQNPITLIGAVITTSAAFTIIVFWLYELVHAGTGPALRRHRLLHDPAGRLRRRAFSSCRSAGSCGATG